MPEKFFRLPIRVYYEDTDFSGRVYHARHLHFFERGRTEALRERGVTHTELLARPEPLIFAVRKMTVEWAAPARIDDLLDIRTGFAESRGARLSVAQEIWRDETLVARAEVEVVSMSPEGRPRRLPGDLLAKLRV
ncbi:MAG: tol-pal system-associated acyl-CoA thioesterase [Amphiplicatus sp.]